MDRQQVKKDLKDIYSIYAYLDLFKDNPEKIKLIEKYKSAVSMAPPILCVFYNLRYIEHNSLIVVADLMGLSESRVQGIANKLFYYFCEAL